MALDSKSLEAAAEAVARADWLILATGAGCSADSGLATFTGIADVPEYHELGLKYDDLCRPELLIEDPALSIGFWHMAFASYRAAVPHRGYDVVESWAKKRFAPGKAYAYTSNVDGYLRDRGMPVCEIHGCVEEYVCSARTGCMEDGEGGCFQRTGDRWAAFNAAVTAQRGGVAPEDGWAAPADGSWRKEAVVAPRPYAVACTGVHAELTAAPAPGSGACGEITFADVPRCSCGCIARPAVMMFNDLDPSVMGICAENSRRYQEWEDAMEPQLQESDERLVILEIGCGLRVPSVRNEAEKVREDVGEARCTHIRVNLGTDSEGADVAVASGAREALEQIDALL